MSNFIPGETLFLTSRSGCIRVGLDDHSCAVILAKSVVHVMFVVYDSFDNEKNVHCLFTLKDGSIVKGWLWPDELWSENEFIEL
jgi:hypothetical protein